ncbi:MAG: accessory gene regulator B family protein [Clostridium celatum]|nr:accessory gene regulator B family protein [Clostridium celatum]MDU2122827.1 accessory gene regulator B family protein [Clostridium celatum]MDU4980613.1 accessory gene regulator B family protein [Clostridium celatum]
MIDKFVNLLIDDLGKYNNYDENQIEQMKYVSRVLIYEFIKFVLILLIFYLLGYFKECALVLLFMVSTKPFTGGYHEDSQVACFMATLIIVAFIIILSQSSYLSIYSCIVLNILSIFCIYNQIPIINKKMPLTREELIKRNRVIGIINTLIFLVLSIIMFNVKWFSQTIVWTAIVQVMLLFNKYNKK